MRRPSLAQLGVLCGLLAVAVPASGEDRVATSMAKPLTASDIDHSLADLGVREQDLQQQLQRAKQQADELHLRSIARGRAYVRLARAGLLPVSGGFDALVQHATRLERLRRALLRDLDQETANARLRRALAQKLGALKDTNAALGRERGSLARSQVAIAAAEEREEAFRRAFMGASWNPTPHTAVYGADLEGVGNELSGTLPEGGIAALKGRLPFPIAGRAEVRRVARSARRGPGLEMMTHLGAAVRAIYPGRVAFADSYGDYGQTVIIDHGARHYSVSANLSEISVTVGDEVAFGQRLGSVASATDSTAKGSGAAGVLYFELRQGGETRDPSDWFGL
jgi:septal ring factor EnvC (AmiA/AmiB activator)